jgi:hypothetical protein
MEKKIVLKDLLGGLASEDIKFLYWCWENKKPLNEMRLKARPARTILHSNTNGDIRRCQIEQSRFIHTQTLTVVVGKL